jgi:hypothetical protein
MQPLVLACSVLFLASSQCIVTPLGALFASCPVYVLRVLCLLMLCRVMLLFGCYPVWFELTVVSRGGIICPLVCSSAPTALMHLLSKQVGSVCPAGLAFF